MFRILHLIDSEGPGGAEQVFLDLIDRLSNKVEFLVCVPGNGWLSEQLSHRGIDTIQLESKGSFNVSYLRQIINIIKSEDIDLIHSHLLGSNVYCSIAGLITRRPTISVFHGAVDISEAERFLTLKSLALRYGSDRVISVSNDLTSIVTRRLSLKASQAMTIYNGVNTDRFQPVENIELRTKLNISTKAKVVCSVGHFRTPKNYELLLEAAKLLQNSQQNFQFIIAGNPVGTYYEQIAREIKDSKLENTIHVLGNVNDTTKVYQSSDYFLLTSSSEGFSIATIEAMACGLPVIATKCGGPEEIITDKKDGILIDLNNANQIAETILMLEDSPLKKELASAARKTAVEKFSLELTSREYFKIYSDLISAKKK